MAGNMALEDIRDAQLNVVGVLSSHIIGMSVLSSHDAAISFGVSCGCGIDGAANLGGTELGEMIE